MHCYIFDYEIALTEAVDCNAHTTKVVSGEARFSS
jgi:hypothetical protein